MRRVLLIIFSSLLLTATLVAVRFNVFARILPHAEYGMRPATCRTCINPLFIGSSMFRKGIYAPDFSTNAYLLAYNGNQPALEACQLQFMIDQGAKIERLVVDMYPYSAVRSAALSDMRMLMDGGARFTSDIYNALGDDQQRGLSAYYRMFVQANNEHFFTFPLTYPLTNARYRQGANESDLAGCTVEYLDAATAEEMTVNQDSLHTDQILGLEKIISLCDENSINLLFLDTPKYHKVYRDYTYANIMRSYTQFLVQHHQPVVMPQATAELLPTELLQSGLISTYEFDHNDASLFSDLIHLSSMGRRTLSSILIPILKQP